MWSGPGHAIVQFRSNEAERHDRVHVSDMRSNKGRETKREGLESLWVASVGQWFRIMVARLFDRISPSYLQEETWREHQPGDNRIPNGGEYGRGPAQPSPTAGGAGRKRGPPGTS